MRERLERAAVEYVRDDLGWFEVEVYGFQFDPVVGDAAAVWLRVADVGEDPIEFGLILNVRDGVIDEFDPADEGQPGTLRSGELRFFI